MSAERNTQQLALFMQARDAKQFGATIDGQLTPSWDDVGPVAQEEYLRDAGAILAAVVTLGYAAPGALEAAEAELTRSALPSIDTLDRCLCTAYSQDAGGGYFEPLVEQEPACPVHSEYVFDPKVAAWVHRESLVAVRERTVTDADLDRFETTVEPIYRSTVEAVKASKFLVSTLAQWVMRLTAEVRRLAAAPVSLEAMKVETAWDAALGGAAWEAVHEHGAFRRDFPDQDYFEQVGSKVRAALATERTIR